MRGQDVGEGRRGLPAFCSLTPSISPLSRRPSVRSLTGGQACDRPGRRGEPPASRLLPSSRGGAHRGAVAVGSYPWGGASSRFTARGRPAAGREIQAIARGGSRPPECGRGGPRMPEGVPVLLECASSANPLDCRFPNRGAILRTAASSPGNRGRSRTVSPSFPRDRQSSEVGPVSDVNEQQRRYKEFLDLLPLTLALAGLPTSEHGKYYNEEQIETRLFAVRHAYKAARMLVRELVAK